MAATGTASSAACTRRDSWRCRTRPALGGPFADDVGNFLEHVARLGIWRGGQHVILTERRNRSASSIAASSAPEPRISSTTWSTSDGSSISPETTASSRVIAVGALL